MRHALGSLRGRLLMLIGLVAVPALGFIVYNTSEERAAAVEKVEADAAYLARLSSREHARQIAGARDLLNTLASLPLDWGGLPSSCPEPFRVLLSGYPNFANLGVLSPEGMLLCSVAPHAVRVDMSRTAAFDRALRSSGVEVGDYQVGLIVQRPVLVLARAIREGPEGRVRAVSFAALELQWFNQLAAEADLPEGSWFSLIDRHGTVLAHSTESEAWVGHPLSELIGRSGAGPAQLKVTQARGRGGEPLLVASAPLPGSEVTVVLGLQEERAFASANRRLLHQLIGLALVALLAVAVGSLGMELVVLRGLRNLGLAARRLGAGEPGVRAPARTGVAELEDLATAFNAMAESLERRHQEALAAHEALRSLSRGMQHAREEEAARIARDLHDDLGQTLTALKLDLSWATRRLAPHPELAGLVGRVDAAIERVRGIAAVLRPVVLDQLGLSPALEWLMRDLETRTGTRCEVDLAGARGNYPEDVSTALFRIVQEALTNVSRHAEAKTVRVRLREESGVLILTVSDDGRGMPPAQPDRLLSIGMAGMRERALLVGGTLELASAPGQGSSISVRIPIEWTEASQGGAEC